MAEIGKYKAVPAAVLKDLSGILKKGFIEEPVEVLGQTFVLRTLTEDEEVWVDGHMKVDLRAPSIAQTGSSRRDARLAAAIKSINGVPVAEMFGWPATEDKDILAFQKATDADPYAKRQWIMTQMLWFLAEDGYRAFVDKLDAAMNKLMDRQKEVVDGAPKS